VVYRSVCLSVGQLSDITRQQGSTVDQRLTLNARYLEHTVVSTRCGLLLHT